MATDEVVYKMTDEVKDKKKAILDSLSSNEEKFSLAKLNEEDNHAWTVKVATDDVVQITFAAFTCINCRHLVKYSEFMPQPLTGKN